jgi:RNA recognition motif-containing protein
VKISEEKKEKEKKEKEKQEKEKKDKLKEKEVYVAPSLRYKPKLKKRGKTEGSENNGEYKQNFNRDENSVKVSNFGTDVSEDDLRLLFSKCGTIYKVFLSKKNENNVFAIITYREKESAEKAIKTLDNARFKYMILHVEVPQKRNY